MSKRLAPGVCRFRASAVMVLLLTAAGCGKRAAEVSGTVTYRGQTLPSGTVTFFTKDNQVVGSSTIVAGKYKIRQVPVGPVNITVTSAPAGAKAPKRGAASSGKDAASADEVITIPSMYGSPDKSGLTYTVKPGPQKHPIELN